MPTIDGGGRDQRIKEALEKKVICRRCQVEMVPKSTFFDYLGHNFHTEIPVSYTHLTLPTTERV